MSLYCVHTATGAVVVDADRLSRVRVPGATGDPVLIPARLVRDVLTDLASVVCEHRAMVDKFTDDAGDVPEEDYCPFDEAMADDGEQALAALEAAMVSLGVVSVR